MKTTMKFSNNSIPQGFTLVELMVSMVLSLFLIAGMVQLFIGTRQVARVQDSLSRVQENGRYAIELIGRELRKAGYKSNAFIVNDAAFPAFDGSTSSLPNIDFAAGDAIAGSDTSLSLRYQGSGSPAAGGDGLIQDCLGSNVAEGDIAIITFSVIDNVLNCQSTNDTTGVTEPQPLVDGVEAFRVSYGEDTNDNNYADDYIASAAVTDWENVVSVRVQLLLATEDDNLTETAQPYTFNGATVNNPGDKKLRRVYSTVISVRNRLP